MNDPRDADLRRTIDAGLINVSSPDIGVAVSGGSDSMALLDLAIQWARARDVSLVAATVDHGLRPEARLEAEDVARFCADRQIEHEILHWRDWDGTGNLQAAARMARYDLLSAWARTKKLGAVLLGHTQNDVAETFLMRLARKSGIEGLAAMRGQFEHQGTLFVRPLLDTSRLDLQIYLERRNIVWSEDPSNDDDGFERVRARKLLSKLDITAGDITQSASYLASASEALDQFTQLEARRLVTHDGPDLLIAVDPRPNTEILHRILSGALRYLSGSTYAPRSRVVINLLDQTASTAGFSAGGCLASREGGNLRISREFNAVRNEVCGTEDIWDNRWQIIGPHEPGLEVRALGEHGLAQCAHWRETGLPRRSLLATPAIWRDETLIAAPIADIATSRKGWSAQITAGFHSFLAR